ncbi:MAG: hypothetical protein QM796_11850 [Chthoniobacteraceae bacterium]
MIAQASDSAYQALRIVGSDRGQDALNHVLSLQAAGGTPAPTAWTVLLEDPQARAGIRQIEIRSGRITSERTPVAKGGDSAAPMDFHQLNLDSDGAFTVANKEASKAQVGFDSADYSLNPGSSGTPVWLLTLRDPSGSPVGEIKVSAADGTVISRNWNGADLAHSSDRAYVDGQEHDYQPPDENGGSQSSSSSSSGGVIGHISNFGDKVKNHFMKDGAALEHFFTGGHSLDRKIQRDREQSADETGN